MANIDKDKGVSLISRKPIREKDMSPERQSHRSAVRKADLAGKIHGSGEHSKVTFTPKNKSEERGFNKRFNSKTA